MHSGHTHAQNVVFGEGANAEQGRDDGYLGLFGQLPEFIVCPGDYDAVSGEYDRTLGFIDHVCGPANHSAVALQVGLVAGQVYSFVPLHIHFFGEDVLWNIHEDGAGSAGVGDVERFVYDVRYFGGVHDEVVVLGYGQGNAGNVGFLEGVGADGGASDLSGDYNHGHGVHHGGADAGDEVRRARAGRRPGHSGPAGDAGVAVRGVGRSLLVANQDVAEFGVLGQYLVKRQNRAAGKSEDYIHAFSQQRFTDYLSSVASHFVIPPLLG